MEELRLQFLNSLAISQRLNLRSATGTRTCQCPFPAIRPARVRSPHPRNRGGGVEAVAGRLGDGFDRVADALSAAAAGSPSPASASPRTSARSSSARSTPPAPAPTRSTPLAPSTATSAWSTRTTSPCSSRTAANRRNCSACSARSRKLAAGLFAITGNDRRHPRPRRRRRDRLRPGHGSLPAPLAPSTSTTVMIALGDALAFALLEQRQFTAGAVREVPPGRQPRPQARHASRSACGTGAELRTRPGDRHRPRGVRAGPAHRPAHRGDHARRRRRPARGAVHRQRPGRLFESRRDAALDPPIDAVMTRNPVVIGPDARLGEAIELLEGAEDQRVAGRGRGRPTRRHARHNRPDRPRPARRR